MNWDYDDGVMTAEAEMRVYGDCDWCCYVEDICWNGWMMIALHAKLCHRTHFKHTHIQSSDLPTVALTVQKQLSSQLLVTWCTAWMENVYVCLFSHHLHQSQ